MILLFHVVSTFPTNHCKSCITPWPWCPTCNFNMSQLQSLKKSQHFFQLQRLVRSKCISKIFKPWQPCCFRTEIQYIHSPSMTTFATTLSFKSEKQNPKIMPLRVVDLRNIDYGMKRYVLQSCCFDNHMSCTTSGSENGGLHKPNALCTQRVALKKELPDSLEKTGQNSAM